jgi:hypothetical protein
MRAWGMHAFFYLDVSRCSPGARIPWDWEREVKEEVKALQSLQARLIVGLQP